MTTPLPREHALLLGRAYFGILDPRLHDRLAGKVVVIVGTGPSRDDEKVPHDTVISLNGAHWMFTPEAFHIGMTRDHSPQQAGMRVYPRGDECDLFVISDRAWERERTPLERTVAFPEPVPVRRLGAQVLAAWMAASLGAAELHFYGCDSVADCAKNGYRGWHGTAEEHPAYLLQPARAKYLVGDTPAVWHVGSATYTDPQPHGPDPDVATPWDAKYQAIVRQYLTP